MDRKVDEVERLNKECYVEYVEGMVDNVELSYNDRELGGVSGRRNVVYRWMWMRNENIKVECYVEE